MADFVDYKCIFPFEERNINDIVSFDGNTRLQESLALQGSKREYENVPLTLPTTMLRNLNGAQYDAVKIATARFQHNLPGLDVRAGFLLGDGPGTGKGKVLAALLLNDLEFDENLNGLKGKGLWLSSRNSHFDDCISNFQDLTMGMDNSNAFCNSLVKSAKTCENLASAQGVLFMTYGSLKKTKKKKKKSGCCGICRAKKFLGDKFDGTIVLNESHAGKNAEHASEHLKSARGKAIVKLQQLYPRAKFIYSSATCATYPEHFACMERLGLWGPTLEAETFKHFRFLSGEGANYSFIAKILKKAGAMVCRSLSMDNVKCSVVNVSSSDSFNECYSELVALWDKLEKAVTEICITHFSGKGTASIKGGIHGTLNGCRLKFFKCMILDSKLDLLVQKTIEDVEAGKSVVITVQSTGESAVKKHFGSSLDNFVSFARHIFINTIMVCLTVQSHLDELAREEGGPSKKQKCEEIPEVLDLQKKFLLQLEKVSYLPDNFLDKFIYQLEQRGLTVADLTGRMYAVQCKQGKFSVIDRLAGWHINKSGHLTANESKRKRKCSKVTLEHIRSFEMKQFNKGKKRVAIISDAGLTGIKLHCDINLPVEVQFPRVNYVIELSSVSENLQQAFATVHQPNQAHPPTYIYLESDNPAERSFNSEIKEKQKCMASITTACEETLQGRELLKCDDFRNPIGMYVLKNIFK